MGMKFLQTAERASHFDSSDNYVFCRCFRPYLDIANFARGHVLELGFGEGRGVEYLSPKAEKYVAMDKYLPEQVDTLAQLPNVEILQREGPPFGLPERSYDLVVSIQVIEHIKDDALFVEEISRSLKPGGRFALATPNIKMTLSRNPWHIREYTVQQLRDRLAPHFSSVETKGVYGNEKVMQYYAENKASVERIARLDIFNLQHRLPRRWLQLPYDLLNRMNRRKLLNAHNDLTVNIQTDDFYIDQATDTCLDLYYIATK